MKLVKSIAAILLSLLLLLSIDLIPTDSVTSTEATDEVSIVDEIVFPHDEVIEINIEIDEDTYSSMIANAMDDTYVMADITYNGYTYTNIAIKPKGNSSLKQVASTGDDRFSFKIDFNYYIDGQNFLGITKLNLNNMYMDSTMMAEYLGYEMLESIDATASRTTFAALSINGEYYGLYLSVEQVNDSYLEENFDNSNGELYKPEMGVGSTLSYVSDNGLDYTGLFPENYDSYDNEDIATLISAIDTGENLDDILDVDSFLKYLAMSTMTVHLDSYQGGMFHNYYLYNNDGVFEWITWDLNMIFNVFPQANLTDEQAISFLIDEPVSGSMSSYPLVEAIFNNEAYVAQYHAYLEQLSSDYLDSDTFNEKVLTIYNMIKDYVQTDTSAFYTYEEFESALFTDTAKQISLLNFIEQRVDNVALQLSGEVESTNDGNGNIGSGSNTQGQMGGVNNQRPGVIDNNDNEVVNQPPNIVDNNTDTTDDQIVNQPPGVIDNNNGVVNQRPGKADGMNNLPNDNMAGNIGGPMDEAVDKVAMQDTSDDSILTGQNIIVSSTFLLLMIGAILFLNKKR